MAGLKTRERDIKTGHTKFGSSSLEFRPPVSPGQAFGSPDALDCFESLLISLQLLFLLLSLTVQTGFIRDKFSQHVFGLVQPFLHSQQKDGGTFHTENKRWCVIWKQRSSEENTHQILHDGSFQSLLNFIYFKRFGDSNTQAPLWRNWTWVWDNLIANRLHQLQNLLLAFVGDERRLYLQVDLFS